MIKASFQACIVLLAAAGFNGSAHAQAASAPNPAANAQAGSLKIAMCLGCHNIPGYQASFPEVHKVPKIAGQNAKFIVAALTSYKKGERRHPSMRAIAGSLSEQDMADLAAYYEGLGQRSVKPVSDAPAAAPSAEVAALLTKGNCASCHGVNFSKPIDPSYPKIAGQYADYLYVALKGYQIEGNPHVGRSNPVMTAQVKQFKRGELKAMANYLASLPGELPVARQPGR